VNFDEAVLDVKPVRGLDGMWDNALIESDDIIIMVYGCVDAVAIPSSSIIALIKVIAIEDQGCVWDTFTLFSLVVKISNKTN